LNLTDRIYDELIAEVKFKIDNLPVNKKTNLVLPITAS